MSDQQKPAEGETVTSYKGFAGRDGIKADTWYTLRDGKPVEAAHETA